MRRAEEVPGRIVGEITVANCKYRTSFGGALFCRNAVYLEGFCKFHYKAFQQGEINELGVINESLSDQVRRREINYHGIELPDSPYLEDRE